MDAGILQAFYSAQENAIIQVAFLHLEPLPGEKAEVICIANKTTAQTNIHITISDNYQAGLAGRINQILEINDDEIFRYDIADQPWTGVHQFLITPASNGTLSFRFKLLALNPDAGWGWGGASATTLELF